METINSVTKDSLILQGYTILKQNNYSEILREYADWKNEVQIYLRKN